MAFAQASSGFEKHVTNARQNAQFCAFSSFAAHAVAMIVGACAMSLAVLRRMSRPVRIPYSLTVRTETIELFKKRQFARVLGLRFLPTLKYNRSPRW